MSPLGRIRPDRRSGQALVEFALVAPIFFLIVFSIIQLGLLLGGQNSLTNAVRETARYAVPYRVVDRAGAATACQIALVKLQSALKANPLTADTATREVPSITYTWLQDPTSQWYVQITVKADYKFPLYVPLISNLLDGLDGTLDTVDDNMGVNNLQISAQEEMRVENDPLSSGDVTTSCS
jgi:Flp pilus assembly protein TadG